ncbi:MAG: hypothetical protein HY064_11995 [Bacteroidetes bacterium]|nr:hypothetical protein [Bacteroidota bacterium]
MRKKIAGGLLILLYIVTGFLREFIFVNINEQSRVTYYHDADSHVSPSLHFLSGWSYAALYYSKWLLTVLFAIVFALLAAITVKTIFNEREKIRITLISYGIIFILGSLFYLAGSLTGMIDSTYNIARFLAGLTETPALLVILIASFLVLRKSE